MALMTTERVKELLNITVTDYDTQIVMFEPIAEDRLNCYLGYIIEELKLGYEPYYARLVWTFIEEGKTTADTKEVSSKSIGKVSISYESGDGTKGVAKNTDNALLKFKPLKLRAY